MLHVLESKIIYRFCVHVRSRVFQILESPIPLEDRSEQSQNQLQINKIQNHMIHLNSAPDTIYVPAIGQNEREIMDNSENEAESRMVAEFIFQKLKSYSPLFRNVVQHAIGCIFIEADRMAFT